MVIWVWVWQEGIHLDDGVTLVLVLDGRHEVEHGDHCWILSKAPHLIQDRVVAEAIDANRPGGDCCRLSPAAEEKRTQRVLIPWAASASRLCMLGDLELDLRHE